MGAGQKMICHEVTKMRNPRYTFSRYLYPYRTYPESFKSFELKLCSQRDLELWCRCRCDVPSLTWPGDLTFGPRRSKFANKMCYWILGMYDRNILGPKMAAPRATVFLRYPGKIGEGGGQNLPPPVRVLCAYISELTKFFYHISQRNRISGSHRTEAETANQ